MTILQEHAGKAPGEHDTRIPSLDGLRAISIGMVLLAHASRSAGFPASRAFSVVERLGYAQLGVRVFFVISGFLITGILLREATTTGRLDLRRFYVRRAFRIFPAFYVYVAVVLGLGACGWAATLEPVAIAHILTYTVNYTAVGSWMTSHFWSLSLEEQFYLVWPPLLARLGLRAGFRTAALFVLLSPVIRVLLYSLAPGYREHIGVTFETGADAILIGCLLARWREELWLRPWYRALLAPRAMLVVLVLVLGAGLLDGRPRLMYVIGMPIKNVGIAILIDWTLRHPLGVVARALNARPIAYVGLLSYSLYIWQQLFLLSSSTSIWLRFPLNLVWVFAAALASFYLVERPFLRLRARIERRSRRDRARSGAIPEGLTS